MARVVVKFLTTLRQLTGEKQCVHGRIKPFYSILVNEIRLSLLEGLDKEIKDGDVIAIFPPVGEGL